MTLASSTRVLRRRTRLSVQQTMVDGWRIDAVGTPAVEPDPGDTITINATATNISDDSETLEFGGVESPGGRLTVPVRVAGQQVGTLTFEAAVTGVPSESIQITVPDREEFVVDVGGETTTIRTSEFERVGDLQFASGPQGVPGSVQVGESFTASIDVGCTGTGPADCPTEQFRVEFAGRIITTDAVSGLSIPDIVTRSATITPLTPGDHELRFVLGDESITRTVVVESDEEEQDPESAPTEPAPEPEEPEPEPAPAPEEPAPAPEPTEPTGDQELALAAGAAVLVLLLLLRGL